MINSVKQNVAIAQLAALGPGATEYVNAMELAAERWHKAAQMEQAMAKRMADKLTQMTAVALLRREALLEAQAALEGAKCFCGKPSGKRRRDGRFTCSRCKALSVVARASARKDSHEA